MALNTKLRKQKRDAEKDTRPTAHARHVRMSPYKVRSVIDLVRGKRYDHAVAILENLPKAASEPVLKCMNSAAANAEHNSGLSKKDLFVAEIFAGQAPAMKRMVPRARGSADRILKRACHITVILDEIREEND